ncbi:MAG TPA: ABC transporter substrate-binding protein [Candidatus Deferrimicrobium sp.]|nr:ABC transporter substrate-binding protein [Candidatus Deferrimicrobium sp.]
MHTKRWTIAGTALATLALTASSIGVVAQDAAVGVPTAPTGYAELDQALNGDFTGTKVTMQTQWIGGEGDNVAASFAGFEAATGIDISVAEVPSGQHETLVNVSLNGGAAADIIQLAQPATILDYGAKGLIKDVATLMDAEKLQAEQPTGAYSTGDNIWAIPYKAGLKSVVWYPIKAFADRGYEVPTTWDELIALSDQIVADGEGSPWCVGINAGPATGWIITDWIEDVMIRTVGEEKYLQWINHELPFSSPEVKNAFDMVGQILFAPDYVLGGNTAILATAQVDPMDPMFNDDMANPGCWMHKQSDWYAPDFNPDKKASGDPAFVSKYVVGEDIGLFYFPVIDEAIGNPVLFAGDALMVTQDRPEVRAVAQFLATPSAIEAWVKAGSAISTNSTTPVEWSAGNYKLETAANLISNAAFLAFDGGDVMPPAVGSGTFWSESVKWIEANGENTDAVLQAIDDSWPME